MREHPITPPRMDRPLPVAEDFADLLATGQQIEGLAVRGGCYAGIRREHLSMHALRLEGCRFTACALVGAHLTDMILSDCDLSNCDLTGCSLQRVRFERCRLTGLILPESYLQHVVFEECRADYANLSGARLRRVAFCRTILTRAALDNCRLEEVCFGRCDLGGAEWYHTRLGGLDLRDCETTGLRVTPPLVPRAAGRASDPGAGVGVRPPAGDRGRAVVVGLCRPFRRKQPVRNVAKLRGCVCQGLERPADARAPVGILATVRHKGYSVGAGAESDRRGSRQHPLVALHVQKGRSFGSGLCSYARRLRYRASRGSRSGWRFC